MLKKNKNVSVPLGFNHITSWLTNHYKVYDPNHCPKTQGPHLKNLEYIVVPIQSHCTSNGSDQSSRLKVLEMNVGD